MASRAQAKFDIRAVDKSLSVIRNINKNMNSMLKPVRNLSRGFKALRRESGLDNLGRGVRKVSGEVAKLAGIAGIAGTAGFIALNKMTQNADEIIKAATNYGFATDALQEWRFVAERSGVSVTTVNKSMQAFSKRMAEARNGTGELFGLLSKIDPAFLKQLLAIEGNTDAYAFLIDAMAKLPTQQQQILLGDKAFSEAGRELVKVTAGGAEAIHKMADEAHLYGNILSKEVLEESAEFQNEMTNVGQIVTGVGFSIASELIPAVRGLLVDFKEWFLLNKEIIKVDVAEFAKNAAEGIKEFAFWVKDVTPKIATFIKNIGGLKTVGMGLALVITGPLLSAIVTLGTALLATPIGWFLGAIALVVGAVGMITGAWNPLATYFPELWDGIVNTVGKYIAKIVGMIKGIGSFFGDFFKSSDMRIKIKPELDAKKINLPKINQPITGNPNLKLAANDQKINQQRLFTVIPFKAKSPLNNVTNIAKTISPQVKQLVAGKAQTIETVPTRQQQKESQFAQQKTDIGGQLTIKIDAEGRPTVSKIKSNNPAVVFNVDAGHSMAFGHG